jgi:phosphatidylglycerol lysyltransferase
LSDPRALFSDHGDEAMAFRTLRLDRFRDGDSVVGYADTQGAWVAAGSPIAPAYRRASVARRFLEAAERANRRASFFGVERLWDLGDLRAIPIGEQPIWRPSGWPATIAAHRRLREQLRRARAKGVVVRAVESGERRAEMEDVARAWLASRPMEPMRFVVELDPFDDLYRHFIAEREGRVIAFLSLVPIPARRGWFLEDLVRLPSAPNGTSELLIDAAMRAIGEEGAELATMGMTALQFAKNEDAAWWMRVARALARPLYDFEGVRSFRERLHPSHWEPVHLVHRGSALLAFADVLRAFAGGPLWKFGLRTFTRRPAAIAWVLGVPLVPWTMFLVSLAFFEHPRWLGFTRAEIFGWALFDSLLAMALLACARHPRPSRFVGLASAASVDAVLSVLHLVRVGFGFSLMSVLLRMTATVAPMAGSVALWSTRLRKNEVRSSRRRSS